MLNTDLRRMARESLAGKWGLAAGTTLLYFIITGAVQGLAQIFPLSGLISLLIGGPFALGIAIFTLNISRNTEPKTEQIFHGFNYFATSLVAYLLMVLFILLWALLLVIPGIIAAISYSMTFFIIADDKNIKPKEALDKSKKMMDGHKMDYFLMLLSFIGWALLCILTLGIGFFWLFPYIQVSCAKFYDNIRGGEMQQHAELIDQV